jgi:hypothetical protein
LEEFLDSNLQETQIGKQLARFHTVSRKAVYENYARLYPQYVNAPLDNMLVQNIANFNEKIMLNVQYFTVGL